MGNIDEVNTFNNIILGKISELMTAEGRKNRASVKFQKFISLNGNKVKTA